jgi:tetratricopeptide (TPR) repeat protein/O-antigen ligase
MLRVAFPALVVPERWAYLLKESILVLLLAWAIVVAGGMDGLISFRGQAGSAVLFGLVVTVWLGVRLLKGQSLPASGIEWPLLVMVAVQIGAAVLSDQPRVSASPIAQTVAYIVLFYLALDLTRRGWPAELTEKSILIGGAIVLLLAALDLGLAFRSWWALQALPYPPPFEHRLYSVLGDANMLADLTNLIWPLALGRMLKTRSGFVRAVLAAQIGLAVLLQVFCYSRGATLGLAVAAAVFSAGWVGVADQHLRSRTITAWSRACANPWILIGLVVAGALLAAGLGWRLLVSRNSATQAPALDARSTFWATALWAFERDPLLGRGPGQFGLALIAHNSAPPEAIFINAHSLLFNTAAETGLLGVGSLLSVLVLGACAVWRARVGDGEVRARWVAVAAMWAGFLTHGLVDYHVRALGIAVPLLVMTAVVLGSGPTLLIHQRGHAGAKTLKSGSGTRVRAAQHHPLWFVGPAVLMAAYSTWSLMAYREAETGSEAAERGEWRLAAVAYEQAARLDPWQPAYPAQAGLAWARMAAEGSSAALTPARQNFERAALLDPVYAPHQVNAGVLAALQGDLDRALLALDRAQTAAPRWGLPSALAGYLEEQAARMVSARKSYDLALRIEPGLINSPFWGASQVRRAARYAVVTAGSPEDQVASLPVQVDALLRDRAYAEAQRLLAEAWQLQPNAPWVYRAFAATAEAQGSSGLAERYLDAADWIQTVQIREQVWTLIDRAALAFQSGDLEQARDAYETAYRVGQQRSPYGWGYAGYTPYGFVYQRTLLLEELAPQVPLIGFDPALGLAVQPLTEVYVDLGDAGLAADFRTELRGLLAGDPDLPVSVIEYP